MCVLNVDGGAAEEALDAGTVAEGAALETAVGVGRAGEAAGCEYIPSLPPAVGAEEGWAGEAAG